MKTVLLSLASALTILCAFAEEPAMAADAAWWNAQWTKRAGISIPPGPHRLLRAPLPRGARPQEVRCVLEGGNAPLPHWVQHMAMTEPVRIAESPKAHYGFPRIVRAANGDLLLFYRVGTTHASDDSVVVCRRSTDGGKAWQDAIELWKGKPGHSAHNPVARVAPDGRVLFWCSNYQYSAKPPARLPGVWSQSADHGATWAPFTRFDTDPSRSSYYVTEAIGTTGGLLAATATFPPSGVGHCQTLIWHSPDGGKTWAVRSELTKLEENKGDEVGMIETEPGTILCLLRDRQRREIYRLWSRDGGRMWSKRESIRPMLDCVLQRPFLARVDDGTLLLSGRDAGRKLVVAYLSRDKGHTFGDRHVIDSFQRDGGYTASLKLGPSRMLFTWYSDSGTTPLKPDIKSCELTVLARPKRLWVRLPTTTATDRPARLFVYYGNRKAGPAEARTQALLRPVAWTDVAETQR